MKIAIFSDIHGNNIALQEAIEDSKKIGVDHYVVLGDSIGDFPFSNEVINTIKELTPYVVKGNREQYVIDYDNDKQDEKWQYKQNAPVRYVHQSLSDDNLEYIKSLPETMSVKIGNLSIRIAHGSPERINERLYLENKERLEQIMYNIEEKVLMVGHTHEKEGYCNIKDKLVITGGVLGIYYQDKVTNYLVLEENNGQLSVITRSIEYDKEELKQAILNTDILQYAPTWVNLSFATIYSGRDINADFIEDSIKIKEQRGIGDGKWQKWNKIDDDIWNELHTKYDKKYNFIKGDI